MLGLHSLYQLTLADLARISCSFPCLETLSFTDGLGHDQEYEIPESNLDLPVNLRSINVCCRKLTTFLGWFLNRKNIPQLTTLRLDFVERSYIEAFTRLLQEVGGSLEHLQFGLAEAQKIHIFQPHHYYQISLTHTPQLRSLKLAEKELLLHLLTSGTLPTHLEQVTVTIAVKYLHTVEYSGTWIALDRVIMDPQTTFRLRGLTIVVEIVSQARPAQIMPEPLKLTEIEAVIRGQMPQCNSRDILHIVPDTYEKAPRKAH